MNKGDIKKSRMEKILQIVSIYRAWGSHLNKFGLTKDAV
jgi:hypothetical protein